MRLIPVDYKSIQPKKHKDYAKVRAYIEEFMAMDTKSVEVMWTDDLYTSAAACSLGFSRAVKKSGDPVEVKTYNGHVYLIRTDLEYTPLEIAESDMDDGRMGLSKYARVFDDTSMAWTRDAVAKYAFLISAENIANLWLQSRGYLFLNEVYDLLGMPRTKDGQVVGWIYNAVNPVGDNYVDFGINHERNAKFLAGVEPNAILDFNVDGNILDMM